MKVTVHLHTILQHQTPDGMLRQMEVDLASGGTLAMLLQHLEVELDPEHLLLAVNGRVAGLDQALKEGDQVNLMPAISGGEAASLLRLKQ